MQKLERVLHRAAPDCIEFPMRETGGLRCSGEIFLYAASGIRSTGVHASPFLPFLR